MFSRRVLRGLLVIVQVLLYALVKSRAPAALNVGWGRTTVVLGREEGVEKVELELHEEVKGFVDTATQTFYGRKPGSKHAMRR